jgi:hypothetical protein
MRLVACASLAAAWAAALAATGCAPAGDAAPEAAAPLFVRVWGVWTPEELNRDVVECAEHSRMTLLSEDWIATQPPAALRRVLRERTIACMESRGWRPR